ncbi:MAG: hypothetical protein RR482_10245 [Clostridia bacterium]
MEAFLKDPAVMKELGFFWTFIFGAIAACIYFGPSIRELIKGIPSRRSKSDQIVENCTEALHLCRAALDNNTEALRDNKEDRDTTTAILIEHDKKSEIRFQNQSDALNRIQSKL